LLSVFGLLDDESDVEGEDEEDDEDDESDVEDDESEEDDDDDEVDSLSLYLPDPVLPPRLSVL
jgi:hypothetical protein